MDKMIAYCGLVCSDCGAYIATQANDQAALERVAAQWREEYHIPDVTVAAVICDGCLGVGGRHCGHCAECEIRACGMARGVVNCAHCADYGCERLERFWGFAPNLRALLDSIRAGLAP